MRKKGDDYVYNGKKERKRMQGKIIKKKVVQGRRLSGESYEWKTCGEKIIWN